MVKPAPRSDDELLAWAGGILRREQERGTYGKVAIVMENGKITRVTIESSEVPVFTKPT